MTDNTKNNRGIFSMITGADGVENMIEKFVNYKNKTQDPRVGKVLSNYKKKIEKISKTMESLAEDEEIILQLRAMDNVNPKFISLYLVRNEYIYARTIFYRHDKKIKDIRVIVGKLSEQKLTLEKLEKNKKFMSEAQTKLISAMTEEIEKSLKKYK